MYSYDLQDMVYDLMAERVETLEGEKVVQLAQRLTATTPGAVPCPVCWDAPRAQITAITDPMCLGTGYIVPGPQGPSDVLTQHGYLMPVPFDSLITGHQQQTEQIGQGYTQYTTAQCIWTAQPLQPQRDDVLIVTAVRMPRTSRRYVVLDAEMPDPFGSTTLLYHATLGLREHGDVTYAIGPADTTAPTGWE